jgi:hypothetical protein
LFYQGNCKGEAAPPWDLYVLVVAGFAGHHQNMMILGRAALQTTYIRHTWRKVSDNLRGF